MTIYPHLSVQLDGDETNIEFPDEGVTTTATVSQVGERLYRLETVPLMVESASFGDVIEADQVDGGSLRFCRVAQKSDWRVYDFILPESLIDGPNIKSLLDRVLKTGGHWERVFGGCLFICLPPNADWDPGPEIAATTGRMM